MTQPIAIALTDQCPSNKERRGKWDFLNRPAHSSSKNWCWQGLTWLTTGFGFFLLRDLPVSLEFHYITYLSADPKKQPCTFLWFSWKQNHCLVLWNLSCYCLAWLKRQRSISDEIGRDVPLARVILASRCVVYLVTKQITTKSNSMWEVQNCSFWACPAWRKNIKRSWSTSGQVWFTQLKLFHKLWTELRDESR